MPVFKKTTFNFYHMKKIIIAVLCLSMGWAAAQKKKTGASNKSNRVSSPQKSYSKNQPLTFGIKAGGGLNKISKSEKQNRVLWWTFRKLLYQRKNGCSTRCSLSAFWNKNKL